MEASRAAIRPRARAMRCFCPPEKLAPRSAISVSNPSGSSATRGCRLGRLDGRALKPPAGSPSHGQVLPQRGFEDLGILGNQHGNVGQIVQMVQALAIDDQV